MASFFELAALLWKGWSTVLTEEDTPQLAATHDSVSNAKLLREAWRRQQEENADGPALWRASAELVQWELLVGGLLSAINGICCTGARPLVLKAFVHAVSNQGGSSETTAFWLIPLFGGVVGVEMCCQVQLFPPIRRL